MERERPVGYLDAREAREHAVKARFFIGGGDERAGQISTNQARHLHMVGCGMRIWPFVIVVALGAASRARADGPASPRLRALSAQLAGKQEGAEAAFWKQLAQEGTPIVEDVADPKGQLLVTFIYRASRDTRAVAIYGVPGVYARLQRLPASDVFAYSALIDPAARFTYALVPGDDLGPPRDDAEYEHRIRMFRPDPLSKHPYYTTSLLELPKAPPQPFLVPQRGTPTGEVVELTVKSHALGNRRSIIVYTPPGFTTKGGRYPLVVMFDGLTSFVNLGLPIMLDEMIAVHKIPSIVLLAIGNVDRDRELPGNTAFADFVALELVPWMRSTYHATDDRQRTVVAGVSYGGIAASLAGFRHPAVYGNVLAQSGSYWWAGDDSVEGEYYPRAYASSERLPLRFWIDVGTLEQGIPTDHGYDELLSSRHMRDVLIARGYDVSYREVAGAHASLSWRGSIAEALATLLANGPQVTGHLPASPGRPRGIELSPARPLIVGTVERMALLEGGAAAAAWLDKHSPDRPDDVNRAARALLDLQRPTEALPILEWNARRFPNSRVTQVSLADGYWHAGDRARALASYRQAISLDPQNELAQRMIDVLR